MQNIAKTREMLGQIGAACVQITRGCEHLQSTEIGVDELDYLVVAFRELLANAESLRCMNMNGGQEKSVSRETLDPALDHDGDTQPSNDPPAEPRCKCGHTHREHMPLDFNGPASEPHIPAGCCIFCPCERFQ
jgi:hypothetical protein